ncbi:hypothetical protein CW304_20880 [Bacillus sp. UFRGS-B20]|nr:hypothetical protein CW304_20880 [Bacillus sp. UFRGS-B20]
MSGNGTIDRAKNERLRPITELDDVSIIIMKRWLVFTFFIWESKALQKWYKPLDINFLNK